MKTLLTTLHSKFIHPSLALPYLAAYCGSDCGELMIREFTVHEPKENVLAAILEETPDVVAFSVYLWNRRETLELIDALAVARPKLRLAVGGPEVSFEKENFFQKHPGLDGLIRGEGEVPFKALLQAWSNGTQPSELGRLALRTQDGIAEGPASPYIESLDKIPSPFAEGRVDLSRGFVYYETSRGCPYQCAFCMSALDPRVRSFSMERIRSDLTLLMDQRVPKIKLVDRTFNYDPRRTHEIFSFILENNRSSHFHFEIGAHLLDEATLELLKEVPADMFQFEIGVQSTLPKTLEAIDRKASLERLEENVRRLVDMGNIHLHLDLIAGLPGESLDDFLCSIDRVAALKPHHLQIEPVKLLPGAPLRLRAPEEGIRFDPNPPYTVLKTRDLSFEKLEQLRGISRLMDLTFNSERMQGFLSALSAQCQSLSGALVQMEAYWRKEGLFRFPLSQKDLFIKLWGFILECFDGKVRQYLVEELARDYARCERVPLNNVPAFFNTDFTEQERLSIQERTRSELDAIKGKGIKLQHFAAVFEHLPQTGSKRSVILFLYLTQSGVGLTVHEVLLS